MLHLRRRHLSSCKHRSSSYLKCQCPIWVVGKLGEEFIRRSLDTRNLERAEQLRREIEAGKMRAHEVPIKTAVTKFVDDVERRCKSETHRKYKYVMSDFEERYKDKTVPDHGSGSSGLCKELDALAFFSSKTNRASEGILLILRREQMA